MQSAVIPTESVVLPLHERESTRVTKHDSGFWGVRDTEVEGAELAAAIALAVHRGVVPLAPRRMIPVRG